MTKFYTLALATVLLLSHAFVSSVNAQQATKPAVEGSTGVVTLPQTKQFTEFEILFEDDFESYANFATEFGPWTLVDVDGRPTYGITNVTFPGSFDPMSFIIFNPAATTPAVTGEAAAPMPGMTRYAAAFASVPGEGINANNDWMIAPKVTLGENSFVRFFAKSYTAQYGLERFRVGVSTTGTSPGDFTIVSPGNFVQAPADAWTEFNFDLSAFDGQEVHVGIHCVSADAFILFIDDFSIQAEVADAELGPFSLLTPGDGAEVTLSPDDNTLVEITWEPSENATNYSWRAIVAEGDFADPLLSFSSDNNGTATSLTLPISAIYETLIGLGVEDNTSVTVFWTVWATAGTAGPLQADEVFSVTFTLDGGTNIEGENGFPTAFALAQNYPNPFNPTTNIEFTLPQTTDVTLEVFNLQGQKVATLVNSTMPAGSHVAQFNAENLSSGIYLYRLTAGSFMQTNKMLLVK